MTRSLRYIPERIFTLRIQKYNSRLISSYSCVADQHRSTDQTLAETRENAIKAREPSYAGWWTEIMNYHQSPQIVFDPELPLGEGHVFQGTPSTTTTPDEIKKGYSNELPTTTKVENSLPTNASHGSTTRADSTPRAGSILYHGFSIPVKPTPPGPEDCCMSGCAHCIYDIYEEDRQHYKQQLAKVLGEIEKAGLPPPQNLPVSSVTVNNDGDSDMNPSMKAFLELERKLKGS
ncbi:hypothetical protein BGZ46_003563 [Entomortierella lignicola]|nr:hypothetical protein BGZ46_003563 [Entomortierella lignicola]